MQGCIWQEHAVGAAHLLFELAHFVGHLLQPLLQRCDLLQVLICCCRLACLQRSAHTFSISTMPADNQQCRGSKQARVVHGAIALLHVLSINVLLGCWLAEPVMPARAPAATWPLCCAPSPKPGSKNDSADKMCSLSAHLQLQLVGPSTSMASAGYSPVSLMPGCTACFLLQELGTPAAD